MVWFPMLADARVRTPTTVRFFSGLAHKTLREISPPKTIFEIENENEVSELFQIRKGVERQR